MNALEPWGFRQDSAHALRPGALRPQLPRWYVAATPLFIGTGFAKQVRRRMPHRLPIDLPGLIGRTDIFRISGGMERDPAVEHWLGEPIDLRSIARQWFVRMRQCGSDVRELMHDGCPVACVADAPFGYVNTFRHYVNVGFFYGAMLEDSAGLLVGKGRRMRHVKLQPDSEIDTAALVELIDAAYVDIRARLGNELSSR